MLPVQRRPQKHSTESNIYAVKLKELKIPSGSGPELSLPMCCSLIRINAGLYAIQGANLGATKLLSSANWETSNLDKRVLAALKQRSCLRKSCIRMLVRIGSWWSLQADRKRGGA